MFSHIFSECRGFVVAGAMARPTRKKKVKYEYYKSVACGDIPTIGKIRISNCSEKNSRKNLVEVTMISGITFFQRE
jgi:hypothetical protein